MTWLFTSMEQWLSNMAHIEAHNFEYALGHKTFSLGMNHYGDLSSAEFAAQYNGFLNSKKVIVFSRRRVSVKFVIALCLYFTLLFF